MKVGTLFYKKWLAAVSVALLSTAIAACGGSSSSSSAPATTAAEPEPEVTQPPVDDGSRDDDAEVQTSPWTTIGTRATLSESDQAIDSNADATWTDYSRDEDYPNTLSQPLQFITMEDGTKLAAYVTLPADADGAPLADQQYPTILIQGSYNGGALGAAADFVEAAGAAGAADPYLVKRGYATVVVDVRGTGQSGGNWEAFGETEQHDYAEVVSWVEQQPWFDGSIGVTGVSYLGITAVITAAQQHPSVKAAFPIVPIGDGYRDIVFTGGQTNITFIPIWFGLVSGLGLTNPCVLSADAADCLQNSADHVVALSQFQVPIISQALLGSEQVIYDNPEQGSFWQLRSPLENNHKINVPTFVVGGSSDLFQRSEPMTYEAIKNQTTAKLLIGPWTHLEAAMGDGLPADGVPALNHIQLQWFDQYLKGMDVGADKLPNVTQFVLGLDHYQTATDWPHPEATAERIYLHTGDNSLSLTTPAADAQTQSIVVSPIAGLCSSSGSQWTAGILGYTQLPCFDNNNSTDRWNVVFETEPMAEDFYFNGPIEADLWISSTKPDASLSVRVSAVDQGGVAKALTNGLQTASLRATDDSRSRYLDGEMIQPWHPSTKQSEQKLQSGVPVLVRVEIFPTSALIKQGERLRVSVGSSNLAQGLPPLPRLLDTLGIRIPGVDNASLTGKLADLPGYLFSGDVDGLLSSLNLTEAIDTSGFNPEGLNGILGLNIEQLMSDPATALGDVLTTTLYSDAEHPSSVVLPVVPAATLTD